MKTARVPASEYFANETEEAARIGCQISMALTVQSPRSSTAYARLLPLNPRIRGAFKTAAARAGHLGNDSIEARQEFDPQTEPTSAAMAAAIRSALDMAHAALAALDG